MINMSLGILVAMTLTFSKATRQFHGQGCNAFNGLLYIGYAINDLKMHNNMAIPFFT